MSSHGPVGPLACPARFERATYALVNKKPTEGSLFLQSEYLDYKPMV
jgi:hypothetical protein